MIDKDEAPLKFSKNLDLDIEQYVRKEMQNSLVMSTGFDSTRNNKPAYQKAALLATAKHQQSTWRSHENLSPSQKIADVKSKTTVNKDLLEHKNAKIREKISVVVNNKYYLDLPIKPGFFFIDSLLKAPKSSFKKLAINIPETLYYSDKLYYLHTENGLLKCTTEINGYAYMKNVEKYRLENSDDSRSIVDKVAAVLRGKSELEGDMHKILLDWNQFIVKMIGNEYSPYTILQRYVRSPGGRPTVTRLYYNSYQKGNKANHAYFITSKLVGPELKSIQKCVVDTSKPETVDVFSKSGVALKPFEKEAEKIVDHLNRGYNLRIEEIILDFVTDEYGVVWFIGCKAIKVDPNTKHLWINGIKEWWPDFKLEDYVKVTEEKVKERQEEKKKGLMSFVHCKLCRLYYQNNELAHLVSVRMLMLYKVHVNRRMDLNWDTSHLKITSNTMLSQSVRVCQYCYMLVTSEFELMKVEEELGKVLSVPYIELGYEEDPRLTVQLQFLPKQLLQWRFLFLCTKIFEFEKLPKSFYIHFNFSGHITTFFINSLPVTNEHEPYIPLSIARMHYLFSSPEKSIKAFLTTFIFEMRITESERFEERVIAGTKGKALCDLPFNLPIENALYQKKQMLFFNSSNEIMCNVSVNIGISCDKLIPSKKIKVLMNKQKDTYIPESHFMTADPLPQEWMELLGYENLDETTFGPQIDEEKFYCPQMSRLEMLRMEDITSPYRKLHSASYDHITSKVLRPVTARLPQVSSVKEVTMRKKVQRIEVMDKIEEVPEEVAPFYRVVSDYLKTRPATAAVGQKKVKNKDLEQKYSFASSGVESLSTLVSPKGLKTDRKL